MVIEFTGVRLRVTEGEETRTAHITAFDPKSDPKCLDWRDTRNQYDGARAVYRLEADVLVIAANEDGPGAKRPAGFTQPPGGGIMIVTLRRVRP